MFKILGILTLLVGISFLAMFSCRWIVSDKPECIRVFEFGRLGFMGCLRLKIENYFEGTFCGEDSRSWTHCMLPDDFMKRDCNLIDEFMQDYFPDNRSFFQRIYDKICCKPKAQWGFMALLAFLGKLPFRAMTGTIDYLNGHLRKLFCPMISSLPFNGLIFLEVIILINFCLVAKAIHRWWFWKKSQKRKRKLYAY